MSLSDSLGKKPRPPLQASPFESNAPTGSDSIEGKPSPSQLPRTRRRRKNGGRRAYMLAEGEDSKPREEGETPSGLLGSCNDHADQEFAIGAHDKTDRVAKPAHYEAEDEDEDKDDGDAGKEGMKKKGLKLRLELDLSLELELKAKIKGSVTLSLLR